MSRIIGLLLVAALASACGGAAKGAFSLTFPDNRPDHLQAVLSRIASATRASEQPVAVALGGEPSKLVVYDLAARRVSWQRPSDSRVAPIVAGALVITHEGAEIVARDLSNGSERFRVDDETLQLVGADGEGGLAAITLSTGGGVGARSRLIIARDGSPSTSRELEIPLGVPAVLAGMIFVPWSHQNMSILDGASGDEIARVRISEEVMGHALARDGLAYVGQASLFRVTPSIARGTRDGAAWLGASVGELPGAPPLLRDAYQPPTAARSATHRVRLDFWPAGTGERIAFADDSLYYSYYRLTFAIDPTNGKVRWARQLPSDVVGAVVRPGGLLVAESSGELSFFSTEDGRPTWTASLGMAPMVVAFRPGSFVPRGTPEGEQTTLADQLSSAVQNTDARLVPAQVWAVRALAALEDEPVTANLITLCDRRDAPEPVRAASCEGMAERVTDPEQLLAALQRHARFLESTTAPPVGALARAAARLGERRAVPELLAHLRDPATEEGALPALLAGLGDLRDRSASEPISDFIRLYHADAREEGMVAAVSAAMRALVEIEGPVARELLDEVAADAFASPEVRTAAREAMGVMDQAEAQAAEADRERETPDGEAPQETAAPAVERPVSTTNAIVEDVLAPVRRELSVCLSSAEGTPRSARVALRLAGDGTIEGVSVTPASVAACIEPLVRSRTFPGNRRNAAEQINYTVRR